MSFWIPPVSISPKSKLGEYMVRSAETTFNEVDLVLMLIEPTTEVQTMDEYVLERIKNVKTPVVLVINKIDAVEREALLEVISVYSKAYPFAEVVADFCHEGQKYRRAAGGNSEISAGRAAVFPCGYGDGQPRTPDCHRRLSAKRRCICCRMRCRMGLRWRLCP